MKLMNGSKMLMSLEIKILNSIKLLQKKNIKINDFSICGGVAANKYLNTKLKKLISTKKLNFHQVPLSKKLLKKAN